MVIKDILELEQENTEIDLSNQAKGIYFVKLTTANGVTTQKLILE